MDGFRSAEIVAAIAAVLGAAIAAVAPGREAALAAQPWDAVTKPAPVRQSQRV